MSREVEKIEKCSIQGFLVTKHIDFVSKLSKNVNIEMFGVKFQGSESGNRRETREIQIPQCFLNPLKSKISSKNHFKKCQP